MTITTLTSREFQQNANQAQKAAREGPVFITNRGRPAYVLLEIEDYRRLAADGANIVELLAMPDAAPDIGEITLEFPPRRDTGRVPELD